MEIKLHPNGWHRRLQKYVFGSRVPLFHNFCPYFWITNFCILVTFIIPIVPFIKLIVLTCGGLSWCFNKAADYFEDAICNPMFERAAMKMSSEEIIETWFFNSWNNLLNHNWQAELADELDSWPENMRDKYYGTNYKKRQEKIKKFEAWKAKTPNWEQIIADYKIKRKADMEQHQKDLIAKREERIIQEHKEAERKINAEKRRQKMFTFIVMYTKWIIYPLLLSLAAFIVYWVYIGMSNLITYAIDHFHYDNFITIMKLVGLIIGGLALVFGFIHTMVKIADKVTCKCCIKCPNWLGKVALTIVNSILWLVQQIGGAVVSAWTIFMIFKKNYCPGINWEEEKK